MVTDPNEEIWWHERRTMLPDGDPRKPRVTENKMLTLSQFNHQFKIVPTSLFSLPKDFSNTPPGRPIEGDCQDYARTARKIMRVKPWQAVTFRCWSPQNGLLPRHAVLWVKGHGWIDSSNRQFRENVRPKNTPIWPVGTPAFVSWAWVTGFYMGWW